jgi:hypothetical protein
MNKENPSTADGVSDDIQEAVNAMIDASRITRVRSQMNREHRREFLIQEAELEAQLLDHEGHGDLAAQLKRVAKELRVLQPDVAFTGQGVTLP